MAAPARYHIYYELDAPDCDPELVKEVDTPAEALAFAQEEAIAAWTTCPDKEPHPDTYVRLPPHQRYHGAPAFFDLPEQIPTDRASLLSVSDNNTLFLSPGDWYAFLDGPAEDDEPAVGEESS